MQTFSKFLLEKKDSTSDTAHFFDMDETIFTHDNDKLKIHVNDPSGKRVASLTNKQFNTYKLPEKHKFDFSEFRSASTFEKSAKPIRPVLAKLKAIHRNNKNVEIVTARSDFDDKERFGQHIRRFGIDINQIHVRRSGNLSGMAAENKKKMISDLINKNGYRKVHLYDDSKENLSAFEALKRDHPNVEFNSHHVDYDHETGKTRITSRKI